MADLLSVEAIDAGVAELDGWSGGTESISRTVSLPTFPAAIGVVDRVAVVAEEMDHHPDIDIRWRKLTFTCATHSAGGVTDRDLTLARRIDEIVADASGPV
jgi:4a-hydroxytetrahydrobiopterin dehydratase